MPLFQVRLFIRAIGQGAYAETSRHIEIAAEDLDQAETLFFATYLRDGRYHLDIRRTRIILERAYVLRIEIEAAPD